VPPEEEKVVPSFVKPSGKAPRGRKLVSLAKNPLERA